MNRGAVAVTCRPSFIATSEEDTMSENESPRNGVVGFLTSLPGILASVGALI